MLKNVSNTFIQNCNKTELTYSEYIIIDNQQIPIRAKLTDDCYENGNFIGSFILKTIQFETSNDVNFKKKEFEYYKVVNGESIKIGTFITTEIEDNDTTELVKVVGMDYGLKTQVQYESELDYDSGEITLLDVWNEACDLAGLDSGVEHFTNDDFIVDGDQFSGTGAMIRDVFVAIGLSSGSFIKVMNDDKIYPIFTESTNEIVEDYTELEDKRDTQPISCLRLGDSQIEGENVDIIDPELVEEYGENWLIINDNPFAYNQAKRSQLITAIFNKVKGFGYSAFVSKTSFKPYLTCGDLIKFKNRSGNIVDTILLRYTHEYKENDLQITLQAPSETSATVNYIYPLSAIDISKRTEIMVDKQNQVISSLAEEVGEYDDRITTVEQTVDRIEQTAVSYEDLKRNQHGVSKLHITNAYPSYPLRFSIKNLQLIYPKETLYPSNTLYAKGRYLVIDNQETLSQNAKFVKLPITTLNHKDGVYDEFVVEKQHAYIIRRIGINADESTYILQDEVIEELGNVDIELFEDVNYIYLYSFQEENVIYEIDYTIPSQFTDVFATEVYVNSSIAQTADEIMLQVNEKVDEDEIIAQLNVAVENGQGVVNLIGNAVTIDSDNFQLDAEGNINCKDATMNDAVMNDASINNANINGGQIIMTSDIRAPRFKMLNRYGEERLELYTAGIIFEKDTPNEFEISENTGIILNYDSEEIFSLRRYTVGTSDNVIEAGLEIGRTDGSSATLIYSDRLYTNDVYAYNYHNLSSEKLKKNIKLFNNALDIIKNTDIYSYNWKKEEDNDKKHYGLIIGENYKTPKEFLDKNGESIDMYTLSSICLQAIKEQQVQIENLQKEIEKLKEGKYE